MQLDWVYDGKTSASQPQGRISQDSQTAYYMFLYIKQQLTTPKEIVISYPALINSHLARNVLLKLDLYAIKKHREQGLGFRV
jgi:hypothetical protein